MLKKKLPSSIYALDVAGRRGVLATKGNRIYCWDTDRPGQEEKVGWEERESSHRYQVTQVKINPSEVGTNYGKEKLTKREKSRIY